MHLNLRQDIDNKIENMDDGDLFKRMPRSIILKKVTPPKSDIRYSAGIVPLRQFSSNNEKVNDEPTKKKTREEIIKETEYFLPCHSYGPKDNFSPNISFSSKLFEAHV